MAERSPGARVVRRRLGRGLRELRELANIRIESAARELECSPAKVSRLENGQGPAKVWDVRILLDLYGVTEQSVRRQFEEWARGSRAESWWESESDLITDQVDRYLAAETVAKRVRIYNAPVLPAIVQTKDYASSLMRVLRSDLTHDDIQRIVSIQRSRQQHVLQPGNQVSYEVIVDEAALFRSVGTAAVHRAQLEWLKTLVAARTTSAPQVDFRIVPVVAPPSRAFSPFTIFEAQDSDLDPPSAFIEEMVDRGVWLDSIDELSTIFDELRGLTAGTDESHSILQAAIDATFRAGHNSAPVGSIIEGKQ